MMKNRTTVTMLLFLLVVLTEVAIWGHLAFTVAIGLLWFFGQVNADLEKEVQQ